LPDGNHEQFAVSLLKGHFKVLVDHFGAVQVFAGVPFFGGYFHRCLLQLGQNSPCFVNVPGLGGLVATAKQKDNLPILDGVIRTEARTKEET